MFPINPFQPSVTRRQLLKSFGCGFGYLALANLAAQANTAGSTGDPNNPLAPRAPHFTPRAQRVIFLFMQGAPSHVDTFDYKPRLQADDGKTIDEKGKGRRLMKSPFKFAQHGQSGLWLPDIFPNLAQHADKLCLLNSMYTDVAVHPQAMIELHSGNFRFQRPSMGAWVLYGLGTQNSELPGFITINAQGGSQNYASGFLPAAFQGTPIRGGNPRKDGSKIANIDNPKLSAELQRKQLDLLGTLNHERLEKDKVNPELEGLIESYELAFRMEGAVPALMDFDSESKATLEAYGIGKQGTDNFGRQCLLARRFAEAGVRFIELGMGGWDQHNNLQQKLTANAKAIDKPIAALLADLDQRGLLKDTLVVWGGEFGRTPGAQRADGRDHNAGGFSMWMAGGGVKGGFRHGATDEHGIAAVDKRMHINDLHATMLYLLGLDHTRLTYQYSGREFRLTDLAGTVAKDVVA
ncbi:MAG TPA: DUF1501 domain-containing protein [Pirellulales bacterium]|nr:DUF1501 domain-containing protein [Pirellulales bacterium]